MASQRKRIFSNENTSHRSNRSTSPPDLLHDFHDSSHSLDNLPGMDNSYNGTPSRRMQVQPTMSDRSWTAGTGMSTRTRARRNSGDNNSHPASATTSSSSLLHVQRHHSGDSSFATPPPRPIAPVHASSSGGGPRQRPSSASLSSSCQQQPIHHHSPLISRNMASRRTSISSGGDYDPMENHNHHSSSYGHGHVHGLLNPGPMKHRRPFLALSRNGSSYSNNKQLIALFGFFTLALLGIAVYQHDAMLQEALQLKEQEVDHHILHAKELEKRLQNLRQHSIEVEEKLEKSEGEPHVDLETQRKLFHLEHNQVKMQQDIQSMSKRLLKEKYGHGPRYYIQMKLEFDSRSNVGDDHEAGDEIVLETASINDMPHSIYLFLEQIDHHLYDHTTFHRNAAHLVQAGPSVDPNAHKNFRHHPSLTSVVFQEYAPEMTHKQYTLGYPGRPGGPDFYINMRDNSAVNGPGGQHTHYSDIILDADPCFAKIVKGWGAVERIHRSAVEPGSDAIQYPVLIANMKVLPADYVLPHSASNSDSDSGD